MAAVVLGLSSSLAWGVADFLGGLQSRRQPLLAVLVISQTVGLVAVLIAVLVRGQAPPSGIGWAAWAVGGGLAGIVGLAAFYRGLATGNMGVVAPISSAAAVVPLVVGLATGERPSSVQAAGLALAIVGVVMTSREEGKAGGSMATGAGLAIVAALGFGTFFVGMDRASDSDPLWAIVAARTATVTALWIAVALLRPKLPRARSDFRPLLLIGLLDTGANLLFALASTKGLVSVVAVLSSVYPVVTVLLAHFVLHERLHALQRVGAVGTLVGAALISAG
jgi:drug/metabolite transporter (DMT)-like permease